MDSRALILAAQVIELTTPERPVDAVLRLVLRVAGHVAPRAAVHTERAVAAYFRWLGWLDQTAPIPARLTQALELAARFREHPETFSDEDLLRAVPEWVRAEVDCSAAWLRAIQAGQTHAWVRARPGHAARIAAKFSASHLPDQPLAPDAVRYDGKNDLVKAREFQIGLFEIQDIASQAVGTLCRPRHGDFWWAVRSGDGGNALHLCDLMENKGVVWATDPADLRLKQLLVRLKRARLVNYRVAVWAGGPTPPREGKFNGVLVDAPCSDLGTWQENPQARWTSRPESLAGFAAAQLRLLEDVAGTLKNGGRLIYTVRTLTRSETTGVVAAFSKKHPEFEPCPFSENGPSSQWLRQQDLGGHGRFIAAWRKPKLKSDTDEDFEEDDREPQPNSRSRSANNPRR
jgi:16S rRNA (cytosine967-C5)-methyltransferase